MLQLSKMVERERELKKRMRIEKKIKELKRAPPGVGYYKPEVADRLILGQQPEYSFLKSRNPVLPDKNKKSKLTLPEIGKYDYAKCYDQIYRPYISLDVPAPVRHLYQ